MRRAARRPTTRLLAWKERPALAATSTPADVNDYVREATGWT